MMTLLELAIDNLSISQLKASTCVDVTREVHDVSGNCAVDALEDFSVAD